MRKKQFKAESKRLLDLMINSIYTHKEIFLREIISNASDACDKLCYLSLTDEKVGMKREDFRIRITSDTENRTLTVKEINNFRQSCFGINIHITLGHQFGDAVPSAKDISLCGFGCLGKSQRSARIMMLGEIQIAVNIIINEVNGDSCLVSDENRVLRSKTVVAEFCLTACFFATS